MFENWQEQRHRAADVVCDEKEESDGGRSHLDGYQLDGHGQTDPQPGLSDGVCWNEAQEGPGIGGEVDGTDKKRSRCNLRWEERMGTYHNYALRRDKCPSRLDLFERVCLTLFLFCTSLSACLFVNLPIP